MLALPEELLARLPSYSFAATVALGEVFFREPVAASAWRSFQQAPTASAASKFVDLLPEEDEEGCVLSVAFAPSDGGGSPRQWLEAVGGLRGALGALGANEPLRGSVLFSGVEAGAHWRCTVEEGGVTVELARLEFEEPVLVEDF